MNLDPLFKPRSVAVIGASNDCSKLGWHVMQSLIDGHFNGRIIPVNPRDESIRGIPAVSSITQCAGLVDLAVVVVPAGLTPAVIEACIDAQVKGVVLITAGFNEIEDPAGHAIYRTVKQTADSAALPVIGPNTFGLVNCRWPLNASFTPQFSLLPQGRIAFISQSGGMAHLIAFLGMRNAIGFSKIVGLGNRLNIDFEQMLIYLNDDPETDVIMMYMEGVDHPRRLIDAARNLKHPKPMIMFKTGASTKGDQAVQSHTGSMAGRSEIYAGAFKQAGILTVDDSQTLLDTAKAAAILPLPNDRSIAVLSGQAGPGLAAADRCEALGLELADFSPQTQQRINQYLPPLALRTNPVDMGPAWYNDRAMQQIIQAVIDDSKVDIVLLLMMFASANARVVDTLEDLFLTNQLHKPLISCILSPPGYWEQTISRIETRSSLVNYPTPERAAYAAANLWRLRQLMQK